ncbi:hypothetical protein ANAEL_03178 [Anaerolineales bacterium]|nr:hypothetical protein ANAEL_03178 [Anaerolineales bacterium]
MIKGKTLIKREVYDRLGSDKVIRIIGANVEITATENKFQMLHLTDGGWVNAGAKQQYVKWQVVTDPVKPPPSPPPIVIDPNVPPQPSIPSLITQIKRIGKIATLLVDWQSPKWGFAPREVGPLNSYPHTVTFHVICDSRKGPRIPLTEPILNYLSKLNGEKVKENILIPNAGWINKPTIPPTVERLTWAANHVIVKEIRTYLDVEYSNVYAESCYATDLSGTFFDRDMRLIVHKFNAFTRGGSMIKFGRGTDCYTPFITDPYINNGDMWIRSDYLEMWPDLPFALSDGTQILEYELFGYKIYGRRADGSMVLLRDPGGFKTNWRIKSPEVPI